MLDHKYLNEKIDWDVKVNSILKWQKDKQSYKESEKRGLAHYSRPYHDQKMLVVLKREDIDQVSFVGVQLVIKSIY